MDSSVTHLTGRLVQCINANKAVIIYWCAAQWYWIFKFELAVIGSTHGRWSHVIWDRHLKCHAAVVAGHTAMSSTGSEWPKWTRANSSDSLHLIVEIESAQLRIRQWLCCWNHSPYSPLSIVYERSNFSVSQKRIYHSAWVRVILNNISDSVHFAGGPPFCLNQDVNGAVCGVIENFFAYPPFQQAVDVLASSLTEFTTIIQVQEILDYVTHSFGPNPLNITNFKSMSRSFNLIIFEPWVCELVWKWTLFSCV